MHCDHDYVAVEREIPNKDSKLSGRAEAITKPWQENDRSMLPSRYNNSSHDVIARTQSNSKKEKNKRLLVISSGKKSPRHVLSSRANYIKCEDDAKEPEAYMRNKKLKVTDNSGMESKSQRNCKLSEISIRKSRIASGTRLLARQLTSNNTINMLDQNSNSNIQKYLKCFSRLDNESGCFSTLLSALRATPPSKRNAFPKKCGSNPLSKLSCDIAPSDKSNQTFISSARWKCESFSSKTKFGKLKWHHTNFEHKLTKSDKTTVKPFVISSLPFAIPLDKAYLEQAARDQATEETLRSVSPCQDWETVSGLDDPCLATATEADDSDVPLPSASKVSKSEKQVNSLHFETGLPFQPDSLSLTDDYCESSDFESLKNIQRLQNQSEGTTSLNSSSKQSRGKSTETCFHAPEESIRENRMEAIEMKPPSYTMNPPSYTMNQSTNHQHSYLFPGTDDVFLPSISDMDDTLMDSHTLESILNGFDLNPFNENLNPINSFDSTSSGDILQPNIPPSDLWPEDYFSPSFTNLTPQFPGYASSDSGINSPENIHSPRSDDWNMTPETLALDQQEEIYFPVLPSFAEKEILFPNESNKSSAPDKKLLDLDNQKKENLTEGSIVEPVCSPVLDEKPSENCPTISLIPPVKNETSIEAVPHTQKENIKKPTFKKPKHKKKNVILWEFIRDILLDPEHCPSLIKWEDRSSGLFRFVQSDTVAAMWGRKKENSNMTYEKLSRAMRYYYERGILERVDGRRLVYKFGPKSHGWRKSIDSKLNTVNAGNEKQNFSQTLMNGQTSPGPHFSPRTSYSGEQQLPSASVLLLRKSRIATV